MSVKRKEYVPGVGLQVLLECVQKYVLYNPKFQNLTPHQQKQVRLVTDKLRQHYQKFSHAYSQALGRTTVLERGIPKVNAHGEFIFKSLSDKKDFHDSVELLYCYKFEIHPVHFLPKDFFDGVEIPDYNITGLPLLVRDYEV